MLLPEWFTIAQHIASDVGAPEGMAPSAPHTRWLRRALASLSRAASLLMEGDHAIERRGLLQAINPRAKVLGLGGLMISASVAPSLEGLLLACALAALLALLSRVPWFRLAPAFVASLLATFIVLPATLNLFTPGHPVLVLWPLRGISPEQPALAVTGEGLFILARFVLRVALCATLALLLAATTGTGRLFRSLRALWVPRLAVMILDLMVRYLEILLRAASDLHLARISRTVGDSGSRGDRKWVAASMGALYRRTRVMAEQTYRAMIARGYSGEPAAGPQGPMRKRDWLFMVLLWIWALVIQMPR